MRPLLLLLLSVFLFHLLTNISASHRVHYSGADVFCACLLRSCYSSCTHIQLLTHTLSLSRCVHCFLILYSFAACSHSRLRERLSYVHLYIFQILENRLLLATDTAADDDFTIVATIAAVIVTVHRIIFVHARTIPPVVLSLSPLVYIVHTKQCVLVFVHHARFPIPQYGFLCIHRCYYIRVTIPFTVRDGTRGLCSVTDFACCLCTCTWNIHLLLVVCL